MTSFILVSIILLPLGTNACPRNCFCTNYKIHCNSATLNDIPLSLSNRTEFLEIRNDNITTLSRDTFANKGLENLKELSLRNINTSTIQDTAFRDLKKLTKLIITQNNIESVPKGTFSGLTELTSLVLSQNNLRILPSSLFEGLSLIRDLDLGYNYITEPHVELFQGMLNSRASKELHILQVNKLKLNHIRMNNVRPGTFHGLYIFTILQLSYNDITNILNNTFVGLTKLKYLYLSNNPLFLIEKGAFNGLNSLVFLQLWYTKLHTLNDYTFQGLSSLKTLQLSYSNITIIKNSSFSELKSLTDLHIIQNSIKDIIPGTFLNTKELKKLDLSRNEINFPSDFEFSGLPVLQTLDLSNNKIESISSSLFTELSDLRSLYLSENKIFDIKPEAFKRLAHLKLLDMRMNEIKVLKQDLFDGLTSLEILNLGNNKITYVHADAFHDMKFLRILVLVTNNITHLEKGTFHDLSRLNILGLKGNHLLNLDSGSLKGMSRLKIFSLSVLPNMQMSELLCQMAQELSLIGELILTGVTSIQKGDFNQLRVTKLDLSESNIGVLQSETFQGIVELQILDLYNCQIHTLSKNAFNYLFHLTHLHMIRNYITDLEADIFSDLISLELLDVSFNQISSINPDTFRANLHLRKLRMGNNIFTNISDHFINVPSLEELDLSSCDIGFISQLAFSGVPNLVELNLRRNQLATIDAQMLKSLTNLESVFISNNPLICDCKLKETWNLYGKREQTTPFLSPYCVNTDLDLDSFFKGLECNILQYQNYHYSDEVITDFKIFRQYLEPTLLGIMFIIGIIGNMLLIFIFIVHPEIRSIPNAPILNLTIADLLSLIFNLALSFAENTSDSWELGLTLCKMFMTVRDLVVGVSVYSVVALCLQRYSATVQMSNQRRLCGLSDRVMIIALILGVWFLALCFAIPAFISSTVQTRCRYVSSEYSEEYIRRTWIIQLLVYCVIPASIVIYFYIKTARGLKESVRNFPGEIKATSQAQKRLRSANMALGLTAMFCVSYGPNFLLRVLIAWSVIDSNLNAVTYISFVTFFLFFCNTCFNPIALYHMSTAFRNLFKKYLFFFCRECQINRKCQITRKHRVEGRPGERGIPMKETNLPD